MPVPLPAVDLRNNLATWRVPTPALPAVGNVMHDLLPNESFDPHFLGQRLETFYFDTQKGELRKNRLLHHHYITLRVRCYEPPDGAETYALSAKTESEKWRQEVTPGLAHLLLTPGTDVLAQLQPVLPAHLLARLLDVSHEQPLLVVVKVCCTRYAVEDDEDRLTLDVGVRTDTGKCLPYSVLECKSTDAHAVPAAGLLRLGLRPLKLSKFLWATEV
jgi:hypothetical protein